MSIERMHFYTLSFPATQCMDILKKVGQYNMYPQDAKKIVQNVKGVSIYQLENPYLPLLEDIERIMDTLDLEKIKTKKIRNFQLATSKEFIEEVRQPVEKIDNVLHQLYLEIEENKQALFILKQLEKQNLNIDELKSSQYMNYRVGKIPTNKKESLSHYTSSPFICEEVLEEDGYLWLVYLCLEKDKKNVDNIFQGLLFEEIYLPDFIHGTFQEAYNSLQETATAMEEHANGILQRKEGFRDQYLDHLEQLYSFLNYHHHLIEDSNYLVDFGDYVSIYAYSAYPIETMKSIDSSVSIIEIPIDMYESKGIEAPIIFHNHWYASPFENFIQAKPNDSIDMSMFIAIAIGISSVILLGDLIIGCTLLIIGLLFHKKKIGRLIRFIGLNAAVGGFMYGTINTHIVLYRGITRMVLVEHGVLLLLLIALCLKIVGTIFMEIVRWIKRREQSGNS